MAAALSNNEFKLIGPRGEERQPGSAATLSCHLSPELSAVTMEIRWFRETNCVCLYKDRQVTEGRGYEGRVSLFTEELERGNVSLQIRDCRWSDRGDYLCQVTNGDITKECTVGVWASQGNFYSLAASLMNVRETQREPPLLDAVVLSQRDREWTEEEKMNMEESALLTELKVESFPGPVLKNLMSLIEEKKAQEEQIREAETELETSVKQTDSKEEALEEEEHGERERIRQISLEIREMQERRVRERVEKRQREEEESREKMRAVVEALRSSAEAVLKLKKKIKQHKIQAHEHKQMLSEERNKEKRRELKREVEREGEQMKEAEQELKRLQEERRRMVKELRLMEIRERSAVKEDRYFIRTLPELLTPTVLTQKLKEFESKMDEKDRQLEALKQKISEMEKNGEKQLEERNKSLEEKHKQLQQKDTELEELRKTIENQNKTIHKKNKELNEKETLLENAEKEVETSKKQLETLGEKLQEKSSELQEMMILLEQQKTELKEKDKQLEEKERLLIERDTQLLERDKQVEEKDRLLEERNKQLQERTDPDPPLRRRNSKELDPPNMSEECSSAASPVSVPVAELRLVLLGRTGCEKSAAGNTILGREERSQAGASTVRQQSESRQGEVAGRQMTVVDTPDWFSPGLSLEELRQDVGHCVHLSAPGPHAFLVVLPVKQSTGEERGMLEKMEEMFGERCWRNTVILFTVTDEDQEKNIEEFVQSDNQEVQRLVEKCGNRFHCLNIKEGGDGSQISELLENIEKMVEGNREKFYSSEIYLETQSQIRAMEAKIMKDREERKVNEEQKIKEKLENEVKNSLRKIEGVIQEHEGDIRQLNDRTTELERKMKEERDEEKKRELQRELERELERRTEMEEKVKRLKENRERERREMEERHRQEMEEIKETYEGEARIEAERDLMKIILPELQRNILVSRSKMQEEFSRQMEQKDTELQELKQRFSQLTETHSLLEEVYERTVRSRSGSERAPPAAEQSKGIPQKFKDWFQ